jgi:cytochrome c oxidase assembly protein subunit 11
MSGPASIEQANRRTAVTLSVVVVGMFAFGYALVPLYDVLCDLTGLNGTTRRLDNAEVAEATVDATRSVTVQFLTSTNGLPWDFAPATPSVVVHPGQATPVEFRARNRGRVAMVGTAVHSVSPSEGARYFVKTECFCFDQQRLEAGEEQVMPVRFIVSRHLPKTVSTMTLAYTFYRAPTAFLPSVLLDRFAALGEGPSRQLQAAGVCVRS